MSKARFMLFTVLLTVSVCSCTAQTDGETVLRQVGGPCEGCEALLEYDNRQLSFRDTLPEFHKNSVKLKISGRVLKSDGITPAPNVIVYIYHTNEQGIYPKGSSAQGWGRRHGYIRGWIKTDVDGKYEFYTFRPGAYPQRSAPAHIHVIVKESDTIPYYLDDYTFDDDPLLTSEQRKRFSNKGGSGIMKTRDLNGLQWIERDLILGMNIPNY